VPERERAQERPQGRRRGDPATEQPPSPPGAQHVAVIDVVGAEHHRVDQRHHLAARVGGPGPVATQPHQIPGQRLDTKALRKRRDERDPRVRDDSLIIE